MPTNTDLEFGEIALRNKLISKKQYEESIEKLEKLEGKYKSKGKKPRLVDVLVQLGYLSGQQAASVEKARTFRAVRLQDKLYARVALKSKFVTKKTIEQALVAQKKQYLDGKDAHRIAEWLLEKDHLSEDQDKAILEVVEKLDANRYVAGKKGKAAAKSASKPAASDDDSDEDVEELDEDEIEEVKELELDLEEDEEKSGAKAKKPAKPAAKAGSDDVIDLDEEDDVEEVDTKIEKKLDEIDSAVDKGIADSNIAKQPRSADKGKPKKGAAEPKKSKSAATDDEISEIELADDEDLVEPAAKGKGKSGGGKVKPVSSDADDISDLDDVDLDEIEDAKKGGGDDDDDEAIDIDDIEEVEEIDAEDDDSDEAPTKKGPAKKK